MAVIARNGGGLPVEGGGSLLPGFGEGSGALAREFFAAERGHEQHGFLRGFRFRLFLLRSGGQFLRFQVDHAQDVGRADAAAQGFGVDGGS